MTEKEYCIIYKRKKWLRWKYDYCILTGHKAQTVLRQFRKVYPKAYIIKTYVEYRKRER